MSVVSDLNLPSYILCAWGMWFIDDYRVLIVQ